MANQSFPMQTLRTFAVSARTLSFTLAAKELNLSQSAVSQQIHRLEEHLNVKLFKRLTRELELTDDGQKLAAAASHSLDILDDCLSDLKAESSTTELVVVATPSINAQWLIKKLQYFSQQYPWVKLSVFEADSPNAMEQYNADVGLLYGTGDWKNYAVTKLYADVLFPVCSPQFFDQAVIEDPRDVSQFQALSDADINFNDWRAWFNTAGVEYFEPRSEIHFDNMSHMIAAAKQGQGIALVRDLLVKEELNDASLVRLFNIDYQPLSATFLVKKIEPANRQATALFENWIATCF